MEKVSMKDVARHAGVSVATVSYVINQSRSVSAESQRRVMESIAALNYHPNTVARSFKTGRSNLIAFVVPDIADLYCSSLIDSIEKEISAEGYQLLLVSSGEDAEKERKQLTILENSMVDAIILATTQVKYADLEKVISGRIPYLFIDRRLEGCPYDSATINTYDAVCEAVEWMIAKGHRKIGYITGMPHLSSSREREKAYQDVMQRHHLPTEGLVQTGVVHRLATSTNPMELITKGCTALLAGNNSLTLDAFFRLAKAGHMPGGNPATGKPVQSSPSTDIPSGTEIALTGFKEGNALQFEMENIDYIEQPVTQLGRAAGRQILRRLRDPHAPARDLILEASFKPLEKR